MAVKNPQFQSSVLNSALMPPCAYYTYHHSHANSAAITTCEGWTYSTPNLTTDEVVALQMQHLRFPTPPITPPYTNNASNSFKLAAAVTANATNTSSTHEISTAYAKDIFSQSVIMKIDQNELDRSGMPPTPEHVDDMAVDIVGLDDITNDYAAALRQETMAMTSGTSSTSSSPKRSEYICQWIDCGRDHNSLEALAAHVTRIHAIASPIDGLYYCRWHGCARMRGFSARYKMLVHARTHTKEKPHQCHLCAKSFSRAENLKIHIRSHSGEKPYICTYDGCQKAYSNSSDRFKHTRTHATDKPYMCKVPGCQKRYTDPSSLRKHVKTFKHATQLIVESATTPCKNITNSRCSDAKKAAPATQQAFFNLQIHQQSNVSVPKQLTHYGNQQLHEAYATKIYSDATKPEVCQLCIPAPMPSHYYISAAVEEDLCSSIKAAQLDYYYATTVGHSPARTKATTSSSCSSNVRNEASTRLSTELEKPLDLRVNRR